MYRMSSAWRACFCFESAIFEVHVPFGPHAHALCFFRFLVLAGSFHPMFRQRISGRIIRLRQMASMGPPQIKWVLVRPNHFSEWPFLGPPS